MAYKRGNSLNDITPKSKPKAPSLTKKAPKESSKKVKFSIFFDPDDVNDALIIKLLESVAGKKSFFVANAIKFYLKHHPTTIAALQLFDSGSIEGVIINPILTQAEKQLLASQEEELQANNKGKSKKAIDNIEELLPRYDEDMLKTVDAVSTIVAKNSAANISPQATIEEEPLSQPKFKPTELVKEEISEEPAISEEDGMSLLAGLEGFF